MSEPFQQARKPNLASQGHAATVLGSAFVVNLPETASMPSPLATLIYWAHWHRRVLRDAENVVKAWEEYVAAEPDRGARLRAVMKYLPIEARRVIMEYGADLMGLPDNEEEDFMQGTSGQGQCEAPDSRHGNYLRQFDERIGYHRDSLNQWRSGFLTPTEPDEEEREKTIAGLEAAISALQAARELFVEIYGERKKG